MIRHRHAGLLGAVLLTALAGLAEAGVKGFGIVFSVEPTEGSTAGGTEVHIAGAGFAYVTQVLFGGKPAHIFEPSVKDGEMMVYTPALPDGRHEVAVVFTSGHRAYLRGGTFRTRDRHTPTVTHITHAAAVIDNVTWEGDLKKVLDLNQQEIFLDTGEKRNATEIMHAYLGTGLEVLADKGGREEFRCDIIETPTIQNGVCEVSSGTPAGYYNFTYVLRHDGVSTRNDDAASIGFGRSAWEVQGLPYTNMEGREYAFEVFPTIHTLMTQQVGRLGGAPVRLEADGLFVGKGDFASRHEVMLDGVPCAVKDIVDKGNTQVITCIPGPTSQRQAYWPRRNLPGTWAAAWDASMRIGPGPGTFANGMVSRPVARAWRAVDSIVKVHSAVRCGSGRWGLGATESLEECAENCFWMSCRFFEFRREFRECVWCRDMNADQTDVLSTTDSRRRAFSASTDAGVYRMGTWLEKYLTEEAPQGPNWKVLYANGSRCAGRVWYSPWQLTGRRMSGGFVQQCADYCSTTRASTPGGNCTYFGILFEASWRIEARCVIFAPELGLMPKHLESGGTSCVPEIDDSASRRWAVFELTRATPQSPPPSGLYPGGRGVLVRVWNMCPKGNSFHHPCRYEEAAWQALQASMNPDYRAQRPMLEIVRTDVVRGAFGYENIKYNDPHLMKAFHVESPYATLADISGNHGVVEEIMGFFVAPVSGWYSFLTWGQLHQEVWLSTSEDPKDVERVAKRLDYTGCRSGGRRRNVYTGCSIFYNYRDHPDPQRAHVGTNISDRLGIRTPSEKAVRLQKGERRFFLKRVALPEDDGRLGHDSSNRRRAYQATGLRIQNPDLSDLSREARNLLRTRKSWPELVLVRKIISKSDGQWRIGLRETNRDEPTFSEWIWWNANEFNIAEALNKMVMPSGTQVHADVWWMQNYNLASTDESVSEYLVHMWRPLGNLPDWEIEYDQMRSRMQVVTVSDGDPTDLFVWPISASFFETPVLEPSASLSVTGIRAQYSTRAAVDGNMSNDTEEMEMMEEPPFPCVLGEFNDTTCSESMGCIWGATETGKATDENLIDGWQIYDTWEECQQRCCQDQDCRAASYDAFTKICKKHIEYQDHTLTDSSTGMYAPITSRSPPMDGYALFKGKLEWEGLQVAAYPGHRSVTFCKAMCSADELCNSFIYNDAYGCFLRTQCLLPESIKVESSDSSYMTYYKVDSPHRKCTAPGDLDQASRNRILMPADNFGSSTSTFALAFAGNRRRGYYRNYHLRYLTRTGWTDNTPVTPEESDGRLLSYMEDLERRLAAIDSACNGNCSKACEDSMNGTMDSDNSSEMDSQQDCMAICLNGCTDRETGDTTDAIGNSTTDGWAPSDDSENLTSTTETTETVTTTYTAMNTSTTMTTTTLPPPPVRIVQPTGDIFNMGDALPQDGYVVGRVEIFFNGQWGTVCQDGFGDREAQIVCNELGLAGTWGRWDSSAQAGFGGSEDQPIWIDDIACEGFEDHLSQCPRSALGVHNCFHSEDAKIWCESVTTTVTTVTQTRTEATTSTTTSFALVPVLPRSGFLRQDLTGRCLGPASCEANAEVQAQECELFLPTTLQRWDVNELGIIHSEGCPGLCLTPSGNTPVSWSDRALVMGTCADNITGSEAEAVEQRFYFHPKGFVQSQWSAKCLDTEGNHGYDDGTAMWRKCETQGNCYKGGVQYEPDMDGQGRTVEANWYDCQSRCNSVAGCAHFSYWSNGGCHIQGSSAMYHWNNNAMSGGPTCQEIISDQKWTFVEVDATQMPRRGLLRNVQHGKCVDPSDFDVTTATLQQCQTQNPATDQFYELTAEGYLRNLESQLCLSVLEVTTTTVEGADESPLLYPTVMATCGSSALQMFEIDNKTAQFRVQGTGFCLASTSGSNGATLVGQACSDVDMSMSWEFVDTVAVAERCASLCGDPGEFFEIWQLYNENLDCQCGTWFRTGERLQTVQEGADGSVEYWAWSRFGLVKEPEMIRVPQPPTVLSSIAQSFFPAEIENMSLYTPEKAMMITAQIAETGMEPHTPFGFTYLAEDQTPFIDSVLVNGEDTLNMSEGDTVVFQVRNFDGLAAADVQVHLGLTAVTGITLTESTVSFTAPPATHGRLVMRVMAGWKGWADFEPVLRTGEQEATVIIFFDDLNEVNSISPTAGSTPGGATVKLTGKGFRLPGTSNEVTLYHRTGDKKGQMAGICNVTMGTLDSLECQMPSVDLSHWASTQFEERLEVDVNGQRYDTSGNALLFGYSRPRTPIVKQVIPSELSFAVTSNVTLVGFNFGLLKREVQVMFGERPCRIWEVNQTAILCQLKRSAMAQPALCTENKDIYNPDCVVKPAEFFVKPTLLVTSRGYGISENSSYLDTRFEVHSVWPRLGSEEGGARVVVKGVGFADASLTPQLTAAALGTLADVESWSNTEIVFVTRKLTLNVETVDLMVNLISAQHKCGTGPDPHPGTTTTTTMGQSLELAVVAPTGPQAVSEECIHKAFRAYVTPNVTDVAPTQGNEGDEVTFTISMPAGYIQDVSADNITVHLGDFVCPHQIASKVEDVLTVSCSVPAFEASTVPIKVRILPLGYTRFQEGLGEFSQSLTIDSMTPSSASKGGAKVVLTGKGFATNPLRHFVRFSDEPWRVCQPIESSYNSLTCMMNFVNLNEDSGSGGSYDISVSLWDTEVAHSPLTAFGSSEAGGLRGDNNYRDYNVMSQEECALRCLTISDCVSFDFSARYQRCFMSRNSFSRCSDCQNQDHADMRYFERRTEVNPRVEVSVTYSVQFSFGNSYTPDIELVWAAPASVRTGLQGTASGCGSDAADLGDGNSDCCTEANPCGVNEGTCRDDSRCASKLQCRSYACSWSSPSADNLQDACCVLEGSNDGFQEEPWWRAGDQVFLRVDSLGDDTMLTALGDDPSNGMVNVSFGGVSCPLESVRRYSGASWVDLGCRLGNVPGGLTVHPKLEAVDKGFASEESTWLILPLNVTGASPAEDGYGDGVGFSLGGGWHLNVTGLGFAPPPGQGSEAFVEVSVCGRLCEVVSGSYSWVECIMPNVTTPEVLEGVSDAVVLPKSRILSRDAGKMLGDAPACFHGVGENHFEVGHSTCAAVFDDDPEVVGGTTGTGCHVGLDFGPYTDARVERIRWHPLYDFLEAEQYVNSKFQIGSLMSSQTCDELSYGWRGVEYRGCQDVSEKGNPCVSWEEAGSYVTTHPELAGHKYCRNPLPGSRNRGIWCHTIKGNWEYCNPKMPDISWTDVMTIERPPKMLWNDVTLSTPVTGRFLRFVSSTGNCQITEMQVIGQLIATSETCPVAVRNVRAMLGPNMNIDVGRTAWRGGIHPSAEFPQAFTEWVTNSDATITFAVNETPTVTAISPMNGTARGGTVVTVSGTNFGPAWVANEATNDTVAPVMVEFNEYSCIVTEVTSTAITCVTSPRDSGIKPPSTRVYVAGAGYAWVKPGTRYRYLDRWSLLDTWANQEPPVADALVSIPAGQSILLDEDTPVLLILTVEGVLVFDNKDIHLQATYIWVKGGTFEIGTEERPFRHRALVTLHGQKYSTIRLPVIGGKVLAVSNTQFTIREQGDNAIEEGNIGTLDIHGMPRLKVWTRLAQTANAGDRVIVLQEIVDWKPGEELMVAATDIPHKHFDGNGLHGAPPMDFHNERVYVESVAADMKTITLTAPLEFTHISTFFTRPLDDEYIDLSAEVALLSRNVKIQGDPTSELDMYGGQTMVAFGGIQRIENAEFYRMGQTGELSRYPIHFHIIQDYGSSCYARYNSIHHSFQRALTIHATSYVHVKGNVAFDIIGHMFFVETGMEKHNIIEGNLAVGAIPLLSGMLESDQEPAGFWTAAPNNVWRDNVAVTGSDGWYFQLPGTPISHSMDVYKETVCPIGDRIGEWSRNRCHHLPGSCIRVYLEWFPRKEPCNGDSDENPQILFNTTCWGIGRACYNAMAMGSIHNHHMTAVEGGSQDYFSVKFMRKFGASHGSKYETEWTGIPHIKDSVFVAVLPENLEQKESKMGQSVLLPQNEQFLVTDSMWINLGKSPVFKGCSKCWSFSKWRQGVHTYRMSGLSFINVTRKLRVYKKDVYWDQDGSLTGTANSYTSWADAFNLGHPDCAYTTVIFNTTDDGTQTETTMYSATGMMTDEPSIFKTNPDIYQHEVRNHTFMTCTTPIRKLNIAWPEPQEVHLRQLTVTNLDTGLFQQHEFEKLELFGWAFPVVANQRLQVRPNFLGMDVTEAGIHYGFSDLMAMKESDALKNKQVADPEWLQLQVAFWMDYDHVKLTNPYSWWVGVRYGEDREMQALQYEEQRPYLVVPDPLETPESLPSMTHGMKDPKTWAMNFRFPLPVGAPTWEQQPLGAYFEARKCPDSGCILGIPDRNHTWDHYILWSEKFGDATMEAITIDAEDWILFDMDSHLFLKNLTINGKLSFDDRADRWLTTGSILLWGLLEIGTPEHPYGQETGAKVTIRLSGNVLDTQDYVYIQEQSLWGKVIAVIGQVKTYGAPIADTWLRLATSIGENEETACLMNSTGPVDWATGSEVAFSVTEFDRPAERTFTRILTQDAAYDEENDCWRIYWSGALNEPRFAGDVAVSDTKKVSLRAVVARVDRSVVFTSAYIDTTGGSAYGGHMEIFDVALGDIGGSSVVGEVDMKYTQFHNLGKGALSAAVKVTFASSFEPPPVLLFHGCSWTSSVEYPLHLESSNVPVLITNNVMVNSLNGGIFLQEGFAVTIKDNAILGVKMADTAPRAIAEDDSQVIVIQYAGIRADVMPVRMIGNIVAGSNDMGYMHPAETCPPRAIFNNEAVGTITGVFLHSQKSSVCQTINLYKIWKIAHVALYLSDVMPSKTVLSNIVIADAHNGVIPYMSVGSAFRRLYLNNMTFIGTSPAGTNCQRSAHCRTQTITDPYADGCSSMWMNAGFRRVGFVTPIQTKNRKSCWATKPAYQCRLMSPAQPTLNPCHQPWEIDIHMQKGLGWTYFEDTTFAYWKSDDCGMTDRAIAPNLWGAEVNFPATFTRTTWYQSDPGARFELSTEALDDAYRARASPCKSSGGGCMGLDQLLFQDADGTLTGVGAPFGTVLPLTPRTDIVWAPLCETQLHGADVGVQVCPNVTVDLLEMVNLDRGAKDIKFGPLVMTPDVEEDNGFEGGVLSSVGPFYASCPCGWDFSFYHILIKPDTTYYTEVMSLPENFRLRYWSPRPDDSVLLEIFYPDSRGVNVFVGGAKEPDMALKLGRKPTLDDEHGAHVVDAQALRLYITLRGSQEGFNAQRDLVVRRTPTVKLKMNIEISIEEFNAEQFQTNLAILLGIPPERIVVAAVQVRRRLGLVATTEADIDPSEDSDEMCAPGGCKTPGRRLAVVSSTALDVSIEPSPDAAAAASGGNSGSTGTEALNAQTSELNQVSTNLQSLGGTDLASAAGGEVTIEEVQTPAEPDEANNEQVPSAEETAAVQIIDITAVAETTAAAEVSAEASCPTNFGILVTVGSSQGIVYPTAELATGDTEAAACSGVDAGFEGSILLSCSSGVLKQNSGSCVPKGCSDPVDVTIGATTASVSPPANMASGMVATQACADVNSGFTGNYELYCSMGALTYDASTCSPGCNTSQSLTVSVAGSSTAWSPSSNMGSGETASVSCEPINAGYSGTISISCFFGVLSANPSGCGPKQCDVGDTIDVTLDGVTATLALARAIQSGLTATRSCADVNSAWGADLTLSCNLGTMSFDVSSCVKACATSDSLDITLDGSTQTVNPAATIASGGAEYQRDCSELNSGYEGAYTLFCNLGVLSADASFCEAKGCAATDTVNVDVGGATSVVATGAALLHGESIDQLCEEVNPQYTGTLSIACEFGAVSVPSQTCAVKPCEPWDFVAATLHGASGLLQPREQIVSGESGVGECGNVNIEYSGDFTLTCNLGVLEAGDSSGCRRTCSSYGSNTTVTVEGEGYTVWPISRIPHGGTGVQACGNVLFGFGGEVELACDDGTLSVTSHNCQPNPCEAGLLIQTTIYGVTGIAPLIFDTDHLGTGLVDCYSINPETTGRFEATCFARTLTLVSETACRKSCTDTSPASVQIDGYNYTVLPVGTIPHNRTQTQNCSAFWPGYEGTIDVQCIDDVSTVVGEACIPLPCPDPRMDDENFTATEPTLPPYFVYYDNCSIIQPVLVGEISYTCIGGQVRTNASACNAPCNTTESDLDIHGSESMVPCATFISSMYDGNAYLTCDDGAYVSNITGCLRACLPGETTTVVVAGDVLDDVTVLARLSSGFAEQRSCGTLDSGYHGTLNLTCSNGLLTDSHSCHKLCLTTSSIDVSIGGSVYSVSPVASIEHDQTGTVSCDSVVSGYTGDVVLTCNEGTVTADTSACMAPCTQGQSISVTFAGEAKSLTLSSEITHGQTGTEGCNSADSGYSGDLVIACSDGVATLSSETCAERSCAEDLSWQMTLGNATVTKALDAEIVHGGMTTLNCSEVNHEWDNEIAVTCVKGALVPDYSACKPACMPDYGTPLMLGSENVTVRSDVRMADGDSFVKQCSDFGSHHQGTITVTCSTGTLSAANSCEVGCRANQTVQVELDWNLFVTELGQVILHSQSADVDCPHGFSGSLSLVCNSGIASVGSSSGCEPLPCPIGTTSYMEYDFVGRNVTLETNRDHNESYSLECAYINPVFRGDFQVVCRYGNITGDFSTCIGDPCPYGTSIEVIVGWQSAIKENPYGQVDHGTTWTEDCSGINSEFAGDVTMTCIGGHFSYDASACVQQEVGCLPTGEGQQIVVANDTQVLRPTSAVALGDDFAVDCGDFVSNYVGTVSGTCSTLGSYVGVQVNCIPQACAAGLASNVTKSGIDSVVFTSVALSHAETVTVGCDSADEALQGDLRLTCHFGTVLADASSCELFCLPSRPGQVILGGLVHTVTPPQAFQDPYGLACSLVMAGFSGQAVVRCNGGAVDADVSACQAMPCAANSSASVTLYDRSQTWNFAEALPSGTSQTYNCSSVNPVYAGSFDISCFASVLSADFSGCTCEDQSCSTAPCQSGDSFSTELSGYRREYAVAEALGSLNSTIVACNDVVAGHDGNLTVLCTGGILKANSSACMARGCSSATPAQQIIVGGATGTVTTEQELVHREHFIWDNCSNLQSGYKGVINTTCYLGELVVDGGSCVPQPCQEDVREVVVAGLAVTVRLTGTLLGTTSPAPHGFEGTGDCSQLDVNLVGSFSVGCTASEFNLDLGQCVLNTCEPPSTAIASLGDTTQGIAVLVARGDGEKETFSCSDVSDAYAGVGQLVCVNSRLHAATSSCSCDSSTCSGLACETSTRALVEKEGVVNVYGPVQRMASDDATTLACGEVAPGYSGSAVGICQNGVFSVTTDNCQPLPCTTSTETEVQVGEILVNVTPASEISSGGGWAMSCGEINIKYEGSVAFSCFLGSVTADVSGCGPAACNDSQRSTVLSNGDSSSILLTASALGAGADRTPHSFANASVSCQALNTTLAGIASASCSMGVYTADATSCGPGGCPASAMSVQMGTRAVSISTDESMDSGASTTRPCSTVMAGWTGDFRVQCSYTQLFSDASGCRPGVCTAGQVATVVLGTSVVEVEMSSAMASSDTVIRNCSTVDAAYEGELSILCEAAVLLANTTGCIPIPQEGTVTQAVNVVQSAVAFSLPEVDGATQESLQAVMDTAATRRAYALTLMESLGLEDEEAITILAILVYAADSAGRRLQVGQSFDVSVNFQLQTSTTQDEELSGITGKIENLGSDGSTEQQTFVSALGSNLEEAAKVDPVSLQLLTTAAEAVKTEGITVKYTEEPRVSVAFVAAADTSTEEPDGTNVVLNALAAIFGVLAAACCATAVIWQIRRSKPMVDPVTPLEEEPTHVRDEEAPTTPSNRPAQASPESIRSAGQSGQGTGMSPSSLAVRNAVNQVAPPSFAVPPEPAADDVEPFWEAPPGGLGEAVESYEEDGAPSRVTTLA